MKKPSRPGSRPPSRTPDSTRRQPSRAGSHRPDNRPSRNDEGSPHHRERARPERRPSRNDEGSPHHRERARPERRFDNPMPSDPREIDDGGVPARGLRRPAGQGQRQDRPQRSNPGVRRPDPIEQRMPLLETPEVPNERKICGINACLAVARQRPDDIIRGYFTPDTARMRFGQLMKLLAATRRAYHITDDEELQKVTHSTHHEGVCLLVREAPPSTLEEFISKRRLPAGRCCIVALEGVGNPHNIGAILRVAAHFGADAVVMENAQQARSAAVARTAEGGAECIPVLEAGHVDHMIGLCRRAGLRIVSSSSHQGIDMFKAQWPERCVIVLGEESSGLPRQRMADSDLNVRIPGTGNVESLNVSVAAGILLGEYWRRWH
jgi:TrmH RNA methyltransferase